MPNCFKLTRIGESEPMRLIDIDEMLCKHFNAPVNPLYWYRYWYDTIGFCLAMGDSFDCQIVDAQQLLVDYCLEPDEYKGVLHHLEILAWFKANFVSDAWVQIGK